MENPKKIFVITGGVLLVLFILFLVAVLFFRLGARKVNQAYIENSQKIVNQEKNLVSDIEAVPSTVTGTVTEITENEIEIKQFANYDLNYEIAKKDVASVVLLEKNPNFDQAKMEQKSKEWQEKLGLENQKYEQMIMMGDNNPSLSEEDKKKIEEIKKMAEEFWGKPGEDPTMSEVIEKSGDWNQIKVGSQIGFSKKENGNVLTVYSSDMNIAPPVKK